MTTNTVSIDTQDIITAWQATVARCADSVALTNGVSSISHLELDRRTDALARRLQDMGVSAERTVGVLAGRPFEVVIGILAALKVGGAFAVLDAELAPVLRADLVARIGASAWIACGTPTPELQGARLVDLDTEPDTTLASQPSAVQPSPEHLAYLVFTSGSTGTPKGVLVDRAGLSLFAQAVTERLNLQSTDRWLQLAPPGFDVILEEVFPTLLAGGTVVCRRDTLILSAQDLHELIERGRITVVEMTTQYWYEYAHWLQVTGKQTPQRLRLLVVGGEHMDPAVYRRWQQTQHTRLVHVYGVTEASCTSTMYDGMLGEHDTIVPLGTPLPCTTVTVRRDGLVVPDGEAGEVYIGGPTLARGYLDDPDTTARKFVDDPVRPGQRVYRTADRGLIDSTGQLVFLGRYDDQLKVRGHRLEPQQVEAALATHPAIEQVAVALDCSGDAGLVAFLVGCSSADLLPGQVRPCEVVEFHDLIAYLSERLPSWAVPTELLLVAELPKTRHGKVDRQRLLTWREQSQQSQHEATAEPAEAQDVVLRIFRQVLNSPSLGPEDDFFQHGGHSLRAVRLITQLRVEFDISNIRPNVVFDHPTPARLATYLTKNAKILPN
ncbi:MAG: non-ribosomal peptide synthetase [Pseudonocardiaceae bacterium]